MAVSKPLRTTRWAKQRALGQLPWRLPNAKASEAVTRRNAHVPRGKAPESAPAAPVPSRPADIARKPHPQAYWDAEHRHMKASLPRLRMEKAKKSKPAEEQASEPKPPSFSERLARQREELAQNPDARKARDARALERMRQSREQDKERGR